MVFFSNNLRGNICILDQEESGHCIKVLRKRAGDRIDIIDGEGTLYKCRLSDDSPKQAEAKIIESIKDWGAHPYILSMAVCPTKNNDRYEWFVEKGTEFGIDEIIPVIGDRSERKVFKNERAERIALSAVKQSLKAKLPVIREAESVKEYIESQRKAEALKLICYCFEDDSHPRKSIKEALEENLASFRSTFDGAYDENNTDGRSLVSKKKPRITILIGPEGDFSKEEAALALDCGFIPVHLGSSRLRTETAALAAVSAVYFHFSK